MRDTVQRLLFQEYRNATLSACRQWMEARRVPYQQRHALEMYALEGLVKATHRYNGQMPFHLYVTIYWHSEVLRGVTDLSPANLLPHRYLASRHWSHLRRRYRVHTVGEHTWIHDHAPRTEEDEDEDEDRDQMLSATARRILRYRFDADGQVARSWKHVAALMCMSEEGVRRHLIAVRTMP